VKTDDRFPALRCRDWARGERQDTWEASMAFARDGWVNGREAGVAAGVKMDSLVSDVVSASFAKTNWEAFQDELKTIPLALVHGDFHPSNIVLRQPPQPYEAEPESVKVLLVDWEVVGVGSGAQDIGQFMISHAAPASRRTYEADMLSTYQSALKAHGVDADPALIKREYVNGGVGRWVWMLGVLFGMKLPVPVLQFFHDQVHAFLLDHGVSADNAPLCRA
jgi:hypothetical protein